MSIYIKNTGYTKTYLKNKKNKKNMKNEIKWSGDYNGDFAKFNIDINDNGNKEHINMILDNKDIMDLLGVQPVNMPLDERLTQDFFEPTYLPAQYDAMVLELPKKRKSRKLNSRKLNSRKLKRGKKVGKGGKKTRRN